jgi:D-alanyl-lipoteichoic acid acyltransferase DltB (MBOAT superfamily)
LPQLRESKSFNKDQLGWGLVLFIFGLFQKSVLADAVFAPVVDQLYAEPSLVSAWDAWIGVLAFSGQIFCDFAGYSTCAIGLALCFGFNFPDNFRVPYGAVGFSDFWRRWHISLSTWLRDYLYIPLGGNRGGVLATSRALMLTMLIGGLWHGASWMFMLWGGLHGIYLLTERLLRPIAHRLGFLFSNTGVAVATFFVVTLTWIPFRASDGGVALAVVKAMFRPDFPAIPASTLLSACVCGVGLVWWHIVQNQAPVGAWFFRMSRSLQTLTLGMCMLGIFLVSGGEPRGFIYFQF